MALSEAPASALLKALALALLYAPAEDQALALPPCDQRSARTLLRLSHIQSGASHTGKVTTVYPLRDTAPVDSLRGQG